MLFERISLLQIMHLALGDLPHLGQRAARLEIRAGHDGQAISFDDMDSPGSAETAASRARLPASGLILLFFLRAFSGGRVRIWAELSREALEPSIPLPDRGNW